MKIESVLFDMGGTIEDIHFTREIRLEATKKLRGILERAGVTLPGSDAEILDILQRRNAEYKKWSEARLVELPAAEIWSDWNLRDFGIPREKIDPVAEELAFFWETRFFHRECRADAMATLLALKERGYRLGVISNTSSRTQVFATLESYRMNDLFSCVELSSVAGVRKPHTDIFMNALRDIGTDARHAAYVGDTVSRDVIGSKRAGFALSFQIRSFMTAPSDSAIATDAERPDHVIGALGEIVDILDRVAAGGKTDEDD